MTFHKTGALIILHLLAHTISSSSSWASASVGTSHSTTTVVHLQYCNLHKFSFSRNVLPPGECKQSIAVSTCANLHLGHFLGDLHVDDCRLRGRVVHPPQLALVRQHFEGKDVLGCRLCSLGTSQMMFLQCLYYTFIFILLVFLRWSTWVRNQNCRILIETEIHKTNFL